MIEVLTKHLEPSTQETYCVVHNWITSLSSEEQEVFKKIEENNKTINIAHLYSDLNRQARLPFKLTAFRSHLRGYCTCQK